MELQKRKRNHAIWKKDNPKRVLPLKKVLVPSNIWALSSWINIYKLKRENNQSLLFKLIFSVPICFIRLDTNKLTT